MKTLMLLLLCSPVLADTLTYQSQTMPGRETDTDGNYSAPVNGTYSVVVTLAAPLPPNLNNQVISPTGYALTCDHCAYLPSVPAGDYGGFTASNALFMFSTDSTGRITAWNFYLSGNFYVPADQPWPFFQYLASTTIGSAMLVDTLRSEQIEGAHDDTVSLSAPSGNWTQSSLSNPAAPVVASSTLLRTCSSTWGPVSNNVPAGVTANASGAGLSCTGALKNSPGAYYTKVTTDGGKTFAYVTLKSLNLGNGK